MNGKTHAPPRKDTTQGAPAQGAGPQAGRSSSFDDYADLLNAFQELAAAAVNKRGQGLERIPLGRHLSVKHANLLEDVRRVLLDARGDTPESRQSATADWPRLAVRLEAALAEARATGLSGATIAAAADDVVLIGQLYIAGRKRDAPSIESDYVDLLKGIGQLVEVFGDAPEAKAGMGREDLQGRPDITVSRGQASIYKHQREALAAVQIGEHLSPQHRALLEKLRATLLLARSEAPNSAYRAVASWRTIEGELRYVLSRAPGFVQGDVNVIANGVEQLGANLAQHYELVHREDVGAALRTPASREEEEAQHTLNWAAAGAAIDSKELGQALALASARRMRDLRHAVDIIQHHLTPIPSRPGEWLLESGNTKLRLRDDEVLELRQMAAMELSAWMNQIAGAMAHAWMDYDEIKTQNGSFKLHVLGGWGGASDPGRENVDHWKLSSQHVRDDVVAPRIREGKLVEAYDFINNQRALVDEHIKEISDYDSDLDTGYKRLSIAVGLTEVALTALVPVAGEAALLEGYGVFAVGGTAMATGGGSALAAELGRQKLSGEELDIGKGFGAGRRGVGIGFSAVTGPVNKAIGGPLGAAAPGVQGLMAESTASALTSGVQSFISGDPVLPSMGMGMLGPVGGRLTKGVEALTKSRALGVVTSSLTSGLASEATTGDFFGGAVGGGIGHAANQLVEKNAATEAARTGGGAGGGGGTGGGGTGGGGGGGGAGGGAGEGVPHYIDPATEPTVWAEAVGTGVPTEVTEDPTYHGPAISTGVVTEHIDDLPTTPTAPPVDPHAPTPATGVPTPIEDQPTTPTPAPQPVDPHAPTPATGVPVPVDDAPTTPTTQPVDPHAPTPATGVPAPVHDEPTTARTPTGGHPTGSDVFRLQVREALKKMIHGRGGRENPEWQHFRPMLDAVPDLPPFVRENVEKAYDAVRNRQLIEDIIVEVWERAQNENVSPTEALLRIAGDRPTLPQTATFPPVRKALTAAHLQEALPFIDYALLNDIHGAYTHMIQELAVARALGGLEEAAQFRQELTNIQDPPQYDRAAYPGDKAYWERVWDMIFDPETGQIGPEGHINRPEVLGPVLHTVLGLPGRPYDQSP